MAAAIAAAMPRPRAHDHDLSGFLQAGRRDKIAHGDDTLAIDEFGFVRFLRALHLLELLRIQSVLAHTGAPGSGLRGARPSPFSTTGV